MKASWRTGINLYIIFMTCIEAFWILGLLSVMPYLIEHPVFVSALLIIRCVVLIRFNYVESRSASQFQDAD